MGASEKAIEEVAKLLRDIFKDKSHLILLLFTMIVLSSIWFISIYLLSPYFYKITPLWIIGIFSVVLSITWIMAWMLFSYRIIEMYNLNPSNMAIFIGITFASIFMVSATAFLFYLSNNKMIFECIAPSKKQLYLHNLVICDYLGVLLAMITMSLAYLIKPVRNWLMKDNIRE